MQNSQLFPTSSSQAGSKSHFQYQGQTFQGSPSNSHALQYLTMQEAKQTIFRTYLKHGSEWKLIKSQIGDKHISYPKNYVYNSIKKATKILQKFQTQVVQRQRKMSSKDTLVSLVEIINYIQRQMDSEKKELSCESTLFQLKKNILLLSFWPDSVTNQEIIELLKKVKNTNFKLKSLGIFKAKNKKNWKISGKGYELIRSLDNQVEIRPKQEENKKKGLSESESNISILGDQSLGINLYEGQFWDMKDLVKEANKILGIEEEQQDLQIFCEL